MAADNRTDPKHPRHRELMLACCARGDHDKSPAQLQREIDAVLVTPAPARELASRLESVEYELRRVAPGSGGLPARDKAKRRRDLTEEREEIKRQIAGKGPSLPKWSEKRGWYGGDQRTLYLWSYQHPGAYGTPNMVVLPGDSTKQPTMSRECKVRIATRDEAERLWQSPLHSGWRVAG